MEDEVLHKTWFESIKDAILLCSWGILSTYTYYPGTEGVDSSVEHLIPTSSILEVMGACKMLGARPCVYLGEIRPESTKPETKKGVCAFLGLSGYYRRFIHMTAHRPVHCSSQTDT